MREFVKTTSRGKPAVWRISCEGNSITVEHGREGGKMTVTQDFVPSVGKEGTKSFVDCETQAGLRMGRLITKKVEKGYRECIDGQLVESVSTSLDWDKIEMPKNFAWYKPQAGKALTEKDRAKRLMPSWKRDGAAFAIMTGSGRGSDADYRIYSAGRDDVTGLFPAYRGLCAELALEHPRSIFLVEIVAKNEEGKDCRRTTMSIARSHQDKAIARQEELGVPDICFWGITHLNGRDLSDHTFEGRVSMLDEAIRDAVAKRQPRASFVFDGTPGHSDLDDLLAEAIRRGYEGLVIYDLDAVWGDKSFNYRGKPDRVAAWKMKPLREMDCILLFDPERTAFKDKADFPSAGAKGRGKHQGMAGSCALYLLEDGRYVHIGDVGTGLDEDTRKWLMHTGGVHVAEIAYESWNEDTRKLVQPAFKRWRHEKHLKECTFDEQGPK